MENSRTNAYSQFRDKDGAYGIYYRDEERASLLIDYALHGMLYTRDPQTERSVLEKILTLERKTHAAIIEEILKGLSLEDDGEPGTIDDDAVRYSKPEPVRLTREEAYIRLEKQRYEVSAETSVPPEWSNAWIAARLGKALTKRRLAATQILLPPADGNGPPPRPRKARGTVA